MNQFFTIRNREGGTKHVFAGTTRTVSKLMKQDKPGADPKGKPPVEKDLYFFHPDHLGSTGYVTDTTGKLFQHIEYFPFGETWVEEVSNTQRTPYRFTGKELDEETGLYYFGARYHDPRTSIWQSADPILGQYLAGQPNSGVFEPVNLALYSYVKNQPVNFLDPLGLARVCADADGSQSCVFVDGNGDGNSRDDDLSNTQISRLSQAFRGFILRNNDLDIGAKGATVVDNNGAPVVFQDTASKMARVVSQFVGANLENGWQNTVIHLTSSLGRDTAGRMDTLRNQRYPEGVYLLRVNPVVADQIDNPSSLARTLTHEFLHRRDQIGTIGGNVPLHRELDNRSKNMIKEWGLNGLGCPAIGNRTGWFGFGPRFFSGC